MDRRMTIEALLVYDVNTTDPAGARRLRGVAKKCEGLGRRVQKSVFEIRSSQAQLVPLLADLGRIVDPTDSVRVYRLERGSLDRVLEIGSRTAPPVKGGVIV